MKIKFPFFQQLDAMDCGPACLRMILKFYGQNIPLEYIRSKSNYGKTGVSINSLAETAESLGLKSLCTKVSLTQLISEAPLPSIIHWDQNHFVVLTGLNKKNKLVVADPAVGIVEYTKDVFLEHWGIKNENNSEIGIALLLETTPEFKNAYQTDDKTSENKIIDWKYLLRFILFNKFYIIQIFLGLIIGSILQIIFPYLTQNIVDIGINTNNLNFIEIVLMAQLMLLFSQTIVDFIRSRVLLHISTKLNITLLSGFWSKLLKLPIQFFDVKHPGDIFQRLGDQKRIESFLTGAALNTFFSMFTLILFSFVLYSYSVSVFLIFIFSSIIYLIWIRIFLKYRKKIDFERFNISSKENNATIQIIYGMHEIKLNNAENTFRWKWEKLQASLFKLNFKNLTLNQSQQLGAFFINQGKNIIITYFVSKLVINGQLTLGEMMAIQYILGQLNSPIELLIGFSQQAQDASISLNRLNDIHALEDEEPLNKEFLHDLPSDQSINIKNLSFTYPGSGNEPVLKNINLTIPQGKVLAIVGISGSGKSTLIKLLLKFYQNYEGEIKIGPSDIKLISPKFWRSITGAVMQDSYIFNDNIKNNIIINDDTFNDENLINACITANILEYVESLPLRFNTKIGSEGLGISGGQKQRLAIARAVYKNPKYIFLDEATNSLDSNNEIVILKNLHQFYNGRTVVVVAHRLSTVKNANKIIVLEKGCIVEEGTHDELTTRKGKYYELVKNQLDLGN